jgi:hypothetical protein
MGAVTSPIRSQAQHTMLTRAASDADYAKRRGIEQTTAQSLIDQHVAAGEPKLPERAEADASGGARASAKPKSYKLLGM